MRNRREKTLSAVGALLLAPALVLAFGLTLVDDALPREVYETLTGNTLFVDTDMGLDDVRALFALLGCERFRFAGIVTVEGSASLGKGTDNLLGLLESLHLDRIPVYKGTATPGLPPPPWRETANALGGASFPPPRNMKAKGSPFLEPGSTHMGTTLYLALGPLGNLARLDDRILQSHLSVILIPVRFIDEDRFKAWNLTWDSASTEKVFGSARYIVLIDLSPADRLEAGPFLNSIEGPSPAALWIRRLSSERDPEQAHRFLYDECAAAALIRLDLIRLEEERALRLHGIEGDTIELAPHKEGNIYVARLKDPLLVLQHLKKIWEWVPPSLVAHGHDERHHHDDHGEGDAVSTKALLKTFHGHLGPYVVLGYRMGRLALERTGSEGHFGISAEVYSVLEPPRSCLIDGIQLGSGCTLGKGNIKVHAHDGAPYAVFTTTDGKRTVLRLKPGIPDMVTRLVDEEGVEAAGEKFLETSPEELFDVEKTREAD